MTPTEEGLARSQILALVYRYAALAREHTDHSEVAKLFEPDATIGFPDGRKLTPQTLGEITRGNRPAVLRHHLTTIDVQFVSADEAHCQCYVAASTDVKMPDHWGRWDDVVKRQSDGLWLFKEKNVVLDGMDPDGWLASLPGFK